MRPGRAETRQPSWQRLDWLAGWWRDDLEAKAWGSQLAVECPVQKGLLQFLQGGEFAFVEAGEELGFGCQLIEHFNIFFLLRNRRKRKALILERSKIDISLSTALSHSLDACLERLKQILDKSSFGLIGICNNSDNTVWKTSVKSQDRSLCNVCRNRNADRPLRPELALRQTDFIVGLEISDYEVISISDIASLDERILTPIKPRIITRAMLRLASTKVNGYILQSLLLPPLPPLTEHGLKVILKSCTGVLEVPFGVGFGGGEARKRFVEQGDNSLLFGEWGYWKFDLKNLLR